MYECEFFVSNVNEIVSLVYKSDFQHDFAPTLMGVNWPIDAIMEENGVGGYYSLYEIQTTF